MLAVVVKSRDSIRETLGDRSDKKTHVGFEEVVEVRAEMHRSRPGV